MVVRYFFLYEILNNFILSIQVEYIYMFKIFYKYRYYVCYPLLIPRIDTFLVLKVFFRLFSNKFMRVFFEGGCGTGLLVNIIETFNIFCFTVDRFFFCIKVLRFNVNFFINVGFNYFVCNWLFIILSFKQFDLIIFNPPYLSFSELSYYVGKFGSEVRRSLYSSYLGLQVLYKLIKLSYTILSLNGVIIIEHSCFQAKHIRINMCNCGFLNICTYDFDNLDRLTYAER